MFNFVLVQGKLKLEIKWMIKKEKYNGNILQPAGSFEI